MKKLISSILICAMGFGMVSCVESVESPSIETIRNSKVEQLKALANLYNAEAQAELIWAKAEAALLAADAAYAQAEAELEGLELQKAKDAYAAQLEALLASYKNDLTSNKALIAEYEATLRANLDALEDAVNARISALYTEYETALSRLNILNYNLFDDKVYLAQLEAEVIDIQSAAEKDIAKSMQTIAEQEEIIADAEAQLAILTDNAYAAMNKDSLYVEYLKAFVAYKDAKLSYEQNEEKVVNEAKEKAAIAFYEMYDKYFNYETLEGIDGYAVVRQNKKANVYWPYMYSYGLGTRQAVNSYYVHEYSLNSFKTTAFATDYAKAVEDAEKELAEVQEDEATIKALQKDYDAVKAAEEVIADFKELYNEYYAGGNTITDKEAALKQAVADTTGYHVAVKDKTAALDELTNAKNEGYAENAYVKALADAQKALKDLQADEDATEAEIATAEAAVANAQKALNQAIYNAEVALIAAKENLAAGEKAIAEAKEAVEAAKEMEKEMLAANEAAVAAVAEIQKAYGEGSEFREFWNGKFNDWNEYPAIFDFMDWGNVHLIADANQDGKPDVDYNTPSAYITEYVTYPKFVLRIEGGPYVGSYGSFEYEQLVAAAEKTTAAKADALTTANNNFANMGEWQKNWDAKEAELREFVAGLNEQLKEVQTLVDAYNEAVEAAQEVSDAVTELKNASEALGELVLAAAGDTDLNDLIDEITKDEAGGILYDAKAAIAEAEEDIAAAEKILEGFVDKNGNTNKNSSHALAWLETKIEKCKNRIKMYESRAEYCQIMVERTKTALDAAISAASAE